MLNESPLINDLSTAPQRKDVLHSLNSGLKREPFDQLEIFELIRHICDPEHPLTLEQLGVTSLQNIFVNDSENRIEVRFTPTIPHCSMATLIGLSIRVKLIRCLPKRFKLFLKVTSGSHKSEHEINKQLNDKERVAAALENARLIQMVDRCLAELITAKNYIHQLGMIDISNLIQTVLDDDSKININVINWIESLASSIIESVGETASSNAEIAGRNKSNFIDVFPTLEEYKVDPLEFIDFIRNLKTNDLSQEEIENESQRQKSLKLNAPEFHKGDESSRIDLMDFSETSSDVSKESCWD